MSVRPLERTIPSIPASDGDGVRLRRSLGKDPYSRLDPFLLLDAFSSDNPDDYLAGFPAHPHRGFETVTYMLDGHMRHEDNLGHRGELRSGGAQWMTAGRGIIHSEMPQQANGRMRGFQLWINLPAREKMRPASYRDIQADGIPVVPLADGGRVKVIAGRFVQNGAATVGPIAGRATEPLFLDVTLAPGARFACDIPRTHNAVLYPYEGQLKVCAESAARSLSTEVAGVLGLGETAGVVAADGPARFLLLAGRPLGEPVVQYGPFVMNTRQELEQAIADYRDGVLA